MNVHSLPPRAHSIIPSDIALSARLINPWDTGTRRPPPGCFPQKRDMKERYGAYRNKRELRMYTDR